MAWRRPRKMRRLARRTAGRVAEMTVPVIREACDRCGYSRQDGTIISSARFRIKTPRGDIFLCMHHWRKHWQYIAERAYETVEM